MISASFSTTNNTVTKGTKLSENRTVIRKLSFAPRSRAALSLTIAAQFLRCRRRSSLVTAVRFLNGQEALSIDYSGAKYVRSALKIAATQKSLFRVVENGNFLNRLRNVHLEKSVATGIFRVRRSPKTAKTPAKVHLRLRFQNLGKPRTAGLCGRAAGACDCGPLSVLKSNGLRHSKILPVKFGFSLKTVHANIAKKSLPQCCSKPLFIAFSTSRTNGPHSLSRMKSGTHATPAPNRAHSGLHAETGAFPPSSTAWSCAAGDIPFIPPCFYIHTFPGSL